MSSVLCRASSRDYARETSREAASICKCSSYQALERAQPAVAAPRQSAASSLPGVSPFYDDSCSQRVVTFMWSALQLLHLQGLDLVLCNDLRSAPP